MLIKSPYDTSYGKLINIEVVIKELIKYLASTNNKNLNYEYNINNNCELVIISGFDSDEKDLPLFEHPVVFKNHRDKYIVAVDLRKYLKQIKEQPLNIKEVAKDQASVNFIISRAIFITDFMDGNYGNYRNMYSSISTSYSLLVSYLINSIVMLNPVEKLYVELTAAHFSNLLFIESDDIDSLEQAIVARIEQCKLSIPASKKVISEKIRLLNHKDKTLDGLVNNIKAVLPSEKANIINSNVIVNVVSNMWYGPGTTETMVMSLEHMPTWMALLYISVSDKTFKKSRLATILDKYSRNIKSTEFEKSMNLFLKEKML